MITSSSTNGLSTKHIRKTTFGRKFSIDVEAGMDNKFVSFATKTPANDRLKDLLASSWQGMRSGNSPILSEAGVGGTYFMKDSSNRKIGVFKPHDEEMGCLNNPKGFTPMSNGFIDCSRTKGVVGGEAAFRECAAYVLDHEYFSGVPATDLVACNYPCFNNSPTTGHSFLEENIKIGSFQEFKEHDFDAEDISPKRAAKFPVNEVHKIAILDIRLFNTDRHGGNILVRKVYSPAPRKYVEDTPSPRYREYNSDADENGARNHEMQFRLDFESDDDDVSSLMSSSSSIASSSLASSSSSLEDDEEESYELIPIDHGYTLPSTVSGLADSWFEWLNWPQAKVPFSRESREYISRLDADQDTTLLRFKFGDLIPPECYKVLRITTLWLKLGAKHNLTPYDLGVRMCRKKPDEPSVLENMCWEAEEAAQCQMDGYAKDIVFFATLAEIMEKKMKWSASSPNI
jgi:hypothetical protein